MIISDTTNRETDCIYQRIRLSNHSNGIVPALNAHKGLSRPLNSVPNLFLENREKALSWLHSSLLIRQSHEERYRFLQLQINRLKEAIDCNPDWYSTDEISSLKKFMNDLIPACITFGGLSAMDNFFTGKQVSPQKKSNGSNEIVAVESAKKSPRKTSVRQPPKNIRNSFLWMDSHLPLPEIIAKIFVKLNWIPEIQEGLLVTFLKTGETTHRIRFQGQQKNMLYTAFYDLHIQRVLRNQKRFTALSISNCFSWYPTPDVAIGTFDLVYEYFNKSKESRRLKKSSEDYVDIVALIKSDLKALKSSNKPA